MVSAPKFIDGPIPSLTDLLVSGFENIGCKITLLSCWGHRSSNENILQKSTQRAMDVISVVKHARATHYDLIYIHTAHSALPRDIPLLLSLNKQNTPVVLLYHGSHSEKLTSQFRLFCLATEMVLRLSDGLLLLSSEEEMSFKHRWPWVRCGVVSNPVALPPFSLQLKLLTDSKKRRLTFVYAGRFIEPKGVLDVIDAFYQASTQVDSDLIMAGNGPLLSEMKQRVEAYNLGNRISFVGYLDRKGMWDLYQRSDVLLLPTYHPEGMPTVVLESIASGLGIITTCTRGNADYLKSDVNAMFVPPRDPFALAQQIIKLASNPAMLNGMRQANLELARFFEPTKVARQQLQVIQALLGGHSK